ncbi:MAG: ATPase, T2SS/T4P/T4SS family [Micrococcales bacterium]
MSLLQDLLEQSPARADLARVVALALEPGVTDVLANSNLDWWRDSGSGLEPVEGFGLDIESYEQVLRLLVALTGRTVDIVSPIADGAITASELPVLAAHGVSRLRVHAALPSGISDAPLLSIRVHRIEVLTLEQLCESGVLSQRQLGRLNHILEQRESFVIVGGTGSGKTTLLRAMLAEPSKLRTVVVEDTAEILPIDGHVVGLQARPANSEGAGRIPLDRLLRESLRMRPDRIVVGEVRGSEALVLLQAMTTGHDGSAATLHANAGETLFSRLRSVIPVADVTDSALRLLARDALRWVVRVERTETGRRVTEIGEFEC